MERKEYQEAYVWNKNRATTMLLLGLSILLIVYIVNVFVKLIYLNNEANELKETLETLIEKNNDLQGDNVIINDNMTITVYDNYMTNGEEVYTFPKDR